MSNAMIVSTSLRSLHLNLPLNIARRLWPLLLTFAVACAGAASEAEPGPDASPRPVDPSGGYELRSTFTLAATPAAVEAVLGELLVATDGPDDPSRYLVELVVERLPEGTTRGIAQALAPYVAAYVNERIDTVAPRLIAGLRGLAIGLDRIATRFGTIEHLEIAPDGRARRTIEGLALDGVDLWFAPAGIADLTVDTRVAFAAPRLEIRDHVTGLPHGAMLRLGFDRVVIPRVVPAAGDLAQALHELVDCTRLGALIAERIGLGTPGLYAQACRIGLTVAASQIYDRLPTLDASALALEVVGTANVIDHDGDGAVDGLAAGRWTGTLDHVRLGAASFEGTRR